MYSKTGHCCLLKVGMLELGNLANTSSLVGAIKLAIKLAMPYCKNKYSYIKDVLAKLNHERAVYSHR